MAGGAPQRSEASDASNRRLWFWAAFFVVVAAFGPVGEECELTLAPLPCGCAAVLFASILALAASVTMAAGVVWGWPALPCQLQALSAASFPIVLIPVILCNPDIFGRAAVVFTVPNFFLFTYVILNLRGWPMLFLAITELACTTPGRSGLGNAMLGVSMVAAAFTKHVMDQRLLLSTGLSCTIGVAVVPGRHSESTWVFTLCYCAVWVFTINITLVVSDTNNVLPESLKQAKFVRLAYIRKLRREGGRITRMQETPLEAFGDPGKAKMLLITSHRWVDRFTCDVINEEHPEGLRLESMVRRIATFFPETVSAARLGSGGFKDFFQAVWRSMCAAEDDVLLFFDFMGLPQVGLGEDGQEILRTAEEEAIFFNVLPDMGSLYEMYPVIVIPEVTAAVASYYASGWCFSEFCTAFLSKTLSAFSPHAEDEYARWYLGNQNGCALSQELLSRGVSHSMDDALANEILSATLSDLEQKRFFNSADRDVVRKIIISNMAKRQLLDAVVRQDALAVVRHLHELDQHGAAGALNHPVDPGNYDRLLHVAVRLNAATIVRLLLEWGADPSAKNYWGDRPSQMMRWPRMSAGARLCRHWTPQPCAYSALTTVAV